MADTTLLYLHGIENDDPGRFWLEALDGALRRDGSETLKERGFDVVAPSYLSLLEGDEPEDDVPPQYTYRRTSDHAEQESAGRYYLRQSELERALAGVPRPGPSPLSAAPANLLAGVLMSRVAAQAQRYRTSPHRRHAIYQRLVKELPTSGDLVIVAHSLGSVVAADLLYHLPPGVRVRLLVTIGSPLSLALLRKHLNRLSDTFPFSSVESWLNVVAHHDPVPGSRGVAATFPEALDVFVDNGTSKHAHDSARYLDQEVVVRALNWVSHETGREVGRADQPLTGPVLALVSGAQFALRLGQAQEPGERRTRFGTARALVADEIAVGMREAGLEHPVLGRLMRDNSEVIRGRLGPTDVLPMLLTACEGNPIWPYEIRLDDKVRRTALASFAEDLGVPSSWATTAEQAIREARGAHGQKVTVRKAAVAAAGIALVATAPALVFAAAPAALAGGAAVVGGLAALGPGGMLGGLAVVGVVGGMGGTVATAALSAGSSQAVQQNVIFVQALVWARDRLQLVISGHPEWFTLVAMQSQLASEHHRLSQVSDSSAESVKEAGRKLHSVTTALEWMRKNRFGPKDIEGKA